MKFFLLLAIAATLSAGIVGTTGDFSVRPAATASYVADAYDDPTPAPMRIWVEQTGVALPGALTLDTDLANAALNYVTGAPGVGEVAFGPGGGPVIPAGFRVNVYYAYFDPLNDGGQGTVTFGEQILGIVAHTGQIQFSDFLRVPGAPYPVNPAFAARGWETQEWGNVDAARTTFTWFAGAASPGDQFRIFTISEVPEPGSLALLGTGLVALSFLRRRR